MDKRVVIQTVAAVVVAIAALVVYDAAVEGRRGAEGLHWRPVLEGAVIGAPTVLVVLVARARLAAASGLVAAALLLMGDLAGFGLALGVIHSPVFWALVSALLVRLVFPGRSPAAAAEDRSQATTARG